MFKTITFLIILQEPASDSKVIPCFIAHSSAPFLSPISKGILSFSYNILGTGFKELYITIKGIFLSFGSNPLGTGNKSSQTPALSSHLRKLHLNVTCKDRRQDSSCEDKIATQLFSTTRKLVFGGLAMTSFQGGV